MQQQVKIISNGTEQLTRDQVVRALAVLSHLTASAMDVVMCGGNAMPIFDLVEQVYQEIVKYGEGSLTPVA